MQTRHPHRRRPRHYRHRAGHFPLRDYSLSGRLRRQARRPGRSRGGLGLGRRQDIGQAGYRRVRRQNLCPGIGATPVLGHHLLFHRLPPRLPQIPCSRRTRQIRRFFPIRTQPPTFRPL